jgi:membrane associated rhomboid family serine protease
MYASALTVTNALLALTCLLTWLGFRDDLFTGKYIFSVHRILGSREYYRFLSSGFLHADFTHLLFNMISLFFIGGSVEEVTGPVKFFIIYASGIIGGNLLSFIINKKKNIFYTSYGASGGVSSILFAAALLSPSVTITMLPIPLSIPLWLYAILFLGVSAYAFKNKKDNIGHDAHLGGAFIGLITIAIEEPMVLKSNPILFTLLFFISLGLFIFIVYGKGPLAMNFRMKAPLPEEIPMVDRYGPDIKAKYTVDDLLDKISQRGIHSLSREEKDFLEKNSKRRK